MIIMNLPQLHNMNSTWRMMTGRASPQNTSSSPPGLGKESDQWYHLPLAELATNLDQRSSQPADMDG